MGRALADLLGYQLDGEEGARNEGDKEIIFLPNSQGMEIVSYSTFRRENKGLYLTAGFVSFLEIIFMVLFSSHGLNNFLGLSPFRIQEQNTIYFLTGFFFWAFLRNSVVGSYRLRAPIAGLDNFVDHISAGKANSIIKNESHFRLWPNQLGLP